MKRDTARRTNGARTPCSRSQRLSEALRNNALTQAVYLAGVGGSGRSGGSGKSGSK